MKDGGGVLLSSALRDESFPPSGSERLLCSPVIDLYNYSFLVRSFNEVSVSQQAWKFSGNYLHESAALVFAVYLFSVTFSTVFLFSTISATKRAAGKDCLKYACRLINCPCLSGSVWRGEHWDSHGTQLAKKFRTCVFTIIISGLNFSFLRAELLHMRSIKAPLKLKWIRH